MKGEKKGSDAGKLPKGTVSNVDSKNKLAGKQEGTKGKGSY